MCQATFGGLLPGSILDNIVRGCGKSILLRLSAVFGKLTDTLLQQLERRLLRWNDTYQGGKE
jgi:hypothetical protein